MNHAKYLFAAIVLATLMTGLVMAQDTTLTVTDTGLVGIGTTSPSHKLDVTGGSAQITNTGMTNNLVDRPFLFLNLEGSPETENADFNGGVIWQKDGVNQMEMFYSHGSEQLVLWDPQTGPHYFLGRDGNMRVDGVIGAAGGFRSDARNRAGTSWITISSGLDNWEGLGKYLVIDELRGARMTIDSLGNVGLGTVNPVHPLEMASGAHVTEGGVWTNASSRSYKEDIVGISAGDALEAVLALDPVRYRYTVEEDEEYMGFIAEDVPDLVATNDRKSLSSMDIIAVLTKVVQEQQARLADLEARLDQIQ